MTLSTRAGGKKFPQPAPAQVRLATAEIQRTVHEQAATQEGLTLAAARDFAARNGMTFDVGLTPEGAPRFSFVLGDEVLVCSSTIRRAFLELAVYLERASGLRPSSGTGGSAPPPFPGR